jgi:hypothetical protein
MSTQSQFLSNTFANAQRSTAGSSSNSYTLDELDLIRNLVSREDETFKHMFIGRLMMDLPTCSDCSKATVHFGRDDVFYFGSLAKTVEVMRILWCNLLEKPIRLPYLETIDELEENSRHFMGIKQHNIPSLIFTLRQSCFSSKVI